MINKKTQKHSLNKAFTLMELMVVIIILGLLAAFVLPSLTQKGEDAKQSIVCIQMKSIGQALKMYKINHSVFPTTSEGFSKVKFDEGKMPKDSWNNNFIYTKSGDDAFEIISFGSNQKEGGDDDIYYSKCGDKK